MTDNKCDLHIHSNFSDSDTEVREIFNQAKRKGLSCISITDHDTTAGLAVASSESKIHGIELVEGIEFSAQHKDNEIHVLGYFIDYKNERLQKSLANVRELRKERILLMAKKLNSLHISVDTDELFAQINNAMPTRLHLALYLVKNKKVNSLREAFRKYLSPGKPAYYSRFKFSMKDTISLIRRSGGLAFLAHPHIIPDQSWIEDFISLGINGLELNYPGMSKARTSFYKNIASKFGLLKSGGSDSHGSYKEFTAVGGMDVPYEWVQEMRSYLTK